MLTSSTSEALQDYRSEEELFDIGDPVINTSLTAQQIFNKDPAKRGSGLGDSEQTSGGLKTAPTAKAAQDPNGQWIGYICIPRIQTFVFTCWVAKAQLGWQPPKAGAQAADISANTMAGATKYECAHVKVYQAAGKRVSKCYGEKVMSITTRPKATRQAAIDKALELEQKLFLDCLQAYRNIAEKYHAVHGWADARPCTEGSKWEWYVPDPDWFTSQGLDAKIQAEPLNVPVPVDKLAE